MKHSMETPIVSIFMITYNHEKYIKQALDSILIQKTNFDYVIVVGEDCSTDNTRKILLEYQSAYPNKFELILHEKNVGAALNQNMTLEACKGKYIALCEGDDFWSNPYKLQAQVDLLEENPDFIACFHNVKIIDSSGTDLGLVYGPDRKTEIGIIDLLSGDYMKTCSLMFKNNKDILLPILSMAIPPDDTALGYCLLMNNSAMYLNEVMAVYRKNEDSVWAFLSKELKNDWSLNAFKKHYRYFYNNPVMHKGLKKILLHQIRIKIKIEIKKLRLNKALKYSAEFLKYRYSNHH